MNSANAKRIGSRALVSVGGIAMLVGAVDPLEGSVVSLAGSGLVTLGTFLSESGRRLLPYWIGIFGAIAVGVGAMFVLSAHGGIGGKHGLSMWWGLLMAPYPVGWILGMANLVVRMVCSFRHQPAAA